MSDEAGRAGTDVRIGTPCDVLRTALEDLDLPFECTSTAAAQTFVVELPGTHRLKTPVAFTVGPHSVAINAFVVRAPAEQEARVHRWLLRRNQRLYGVAYAIDHLGDVYLVARLPLSVLTIRAVDTLLGSIAATADGDFDTLLEMGFETAIRSEWQWRLARGESTANLAAFRHLAPSDVVPQHAKAPRGGAGFDHDR